MRTRSLVFHAVGDQTRLHRDELEPACVARLDPTRLCSTGLPRRSYIPLRIVNRFVADLDEDLQPRGRVIPRWGEANDLGEAFPDALENPTTSETAHEVGLDGCCRNIFQDDRRQRCIFGVAFSSEPE